jgi:hypothetical protein
MTRSGAALLALVVAAVGLSGCGYTPRTTFPAGVRSIHVPIFKNRSFYQGAEFDLTEALTKEIERRTPYKVVSTGGADTELTGGINSIEQVRLSQVKQGGLPEEMELRVNVNFVWKNSRTGEVIRERSGIETVGRYIPNRAVGETYSIGQHEAVDRMAQQIVAAMRGDW